MDLLNRTLTLFFIFGSLAASAQLALNESYSVLEEENASVKDITAPSTDLLRSEAGDFIFGPATRIKFKIVEEESGLETTNFKIANLPYMKSDGRQMVPHDLEDGEYKIEYYSVDKSGNQEQVRIGKIYIDKRGPIISTEFKTKPNAFEDGLPVFSEEIKLHIEAADEKVDVQKLTYSINDGPILQSDNDEFIDLTQELIQVSDELIQVEIRAYDSFYNLSKEVIEFKRKK